MPHPSSSFRAVLEVARDVAELAPIVAFLFISSIPTESLAFVNNIEAPIRPLEFARDSDLASYAIVGVEAWPRTSEWLASSMSRISDVPSGISTGSIIDAVATSYSSTPDQTDANPFNTASGTRVHEGTLAANFLPFGAQVRIGANTYTVEDRLNTRYNGKAIVDVWHASREEALQFGVRRVKLTVISLP